MLICIYSPPYKGGARGGSLPIRFHFVGAGEVAFRHVEQLLLYHLLAQAADVVDEHTAFEVVELMLDDAGDEAIDPLVVWLKVAVEILDAHLAWTTYLLMDAWEREAAFFVVVGVFALFDDVAVDISTEEALELGLIFADAVEVNHHDTDGQTHLWCCQSDAFGILQRLKHVVDEVLQTFIIRRDVFGHLAQHGLTEYVHW